MDGRFRRLWARRKTKSNISHNDSIPSVNGSGSQSRPSFSTLGDGRPSLALSSNPVDRSSSQDKLASSRDFMSVNPETYNRPKSGNRIQPMLIGVSRPINPVTGRPSTAGSLQTAVQQAANDHSTFQTTITTTQKVGRSPRYVDIFTVASSIPTYKSQYNEEIAERNLNVLRLAMEEEQTGYIPTSKYQEEVANRNATRPNSSRASMETGRRSVDGRGIYGKTGQETIGSRTNGSHSLQSTNQHSPIIGRASLDNSAFHSRQYAPRSQENGTHLPAIPQERIGDDDGRKLQHSIVADIEKSKPLGISVSRGALQPPFNKQTISETLSTGNKAPDFRHVQPQRSLSATSNHSQSAVATYQLAASELSSLEPPPKSALRKLESKAPADGLAIIPPPRALFEGNAVLRRHLDLPGRTIMDLTSEDDNKSEASSTYGYSNYSPVIEQAKTESVKRPQNTSTSTSTSTRTIVDSQGTGRSLNLIRKPEIQESIPDRNVNEKQPEQTKSKSSFSPINTLAASSPRSSTVLLDDEAMSKIQSASVALAAQGFNDPIPAVEPSLKSVPSKESESTLGPPSTHDSSADSTPKADVINALSKANALPVVEPLELAPNAKIDTPKETVQTPQKPPKSDATIPQSSPIIYDSPQSLSSVDYTNPGDSFGVRTRDFALSPRRSAPSLKKKDSRSLQKSATENAAKAASENRSKSATKAPKSRVKQNTSATRKAASTGWDEEAFVRKQAEARAALIRLQQSLKEDFMTMPEPTIAKSRIAYDSESDGRPVAPTSIFSQNKRPAAPNSASQRSESEKPPSSFRGPPLEASRTSSMSSTRSRSGGRYSRKSAPPSLKDVEAAAMPINQMQLPPSLLQILQNTTKPPRSPGEISLSSFPIPSSRPNSDHEQANGSVMRPGVLAHMRHDSGKSQASQSSQYSIPFHMIPDRSSSFRDTLAEEEDEDVY